MKPAKPLIRSLPPTALANLLRQEGHPPFRARQLTAWLFDKGALRWEEMTNLPSSLRSELGDRFALSGLNQVSRLVSTDGTRKFLFALRDGHTVECVIIPMEDYATFCLSCQVGCRMACRFCATARGGLARQLEPGEILEQVTHLTHDLTRNPFDHHGGRKFNLVFMGMGEPTDNWESVVGSLETLASPDGFGISPRRITLSTCGTEVGVARLLRSPLPVGLTLSVGAIDGRLRRKLLPVAGRSSLRAVLDLAERYAQRLGRRVTLAYVLIAGMTDRLKEARGLAQLVAGRPFKVNLIPLNPVQGDPLRTAGSNQTQRFQEILVQAGVPVFLRQSGGLDIAAACGQLRRQRQGHGPYGSAP